MRSLLLRCYPARWRARYGDEFEAILDERPLGPFDVADILLGALDAQLRLRRVGSDITHGRGLSMSLRIGGLAAVLGGTLWAIGVGTSLGLVWDFGSAASSPLLVAGSLALLVALAGLSAFEARMHQVLSWGAFALPAFGTIVCGYGVIRGSWTEFASGGLAVFVGCVLFAIATYWTAALSRRAALLLGFGSVMSLVLLSGLGSDLPPLFVVAALSCFGLGWCALGVQAIRMDQPSTEPRPA